MGRWLAVLVARLAVLVARLAVLAARLGLAVDDLLALNSADHPELTATTKLKVGTQLIVRDRASEPDVFLPTQKQERALDLDGSIAAELQAQHRYGDPTSTGVVWLPKVPRLWPFFWDRTNPVCKNLYSGDEAPLFLGRLAAPAARTAGEWWIARRLACIVDVGVTVAVKNELANAYKL